MASKRLRSRLAMVSDWLLGIRQQSATSRPSYISTATRPTPPIAHPKSKRSARAASASSTSTTAVMVGPVESPREGGMLPTRSRLTIT